jgi:hypothetical protein
LKQATTKDSSEVQPQPRPAKRKDDMTDVKPPPAPATATAVAKEIRPKRLVARGNPPRKRSRSLAEFGRGIQQKAGSHNEREREREREDQPVYSTLRLYYHMTCSTRVWSFLLLGCLARRPTLHKVPCALNFGIRASSFLYRERSQVPEPDLEISLLAQAAFSSCLCTTRFRCIHNIGSESLPLLVRCRLSSSILLHSC